MHAQLLIRRTSGDRRLAWGFALVAMSAAIYLQAATVDPDFRPVFGNGFSTDPDAGIDTVMLDGRIIFGDGYVRWMPDGSVDPTYHPPEDERRYVKTLYTGQLVATYDWRESEDGGDLVWLDSSGRKTEAGFDLEYLGTPFASGAFKQYVNGQHLLFGRFDSVNGVPRSRLAKINGDGSVDLSFDAGELSDEIEGIWAQRSGKILLWGDFTEFAGYDRPGLVRLNSNGTIDLTFTPDSPDGLVQVGRVAEDSEGRILRSFPDRIYRSNPNGTDSELLVEFDGDADVLVGKFVPLEGGAFLVRAPFQYIGGVYRPYIAKINGDGSVDEDFDVSAAMRPVGSFSIYPMADGRFVFGSSRKIARLLADGSVDPSFRPARSGPSSVDAATVQPDGKIVVGGNFTQVDGVLRSGLVRLDPDGTVDQDFDPENGLVLSEIRSIATDIEGGVWVVGGPLAPNGDTLPLLARYLPDGSLDPDVHIEFGANSVIQSVVVDSQGRVTFGGRFNTVNGYIRNGLARLNADHSVDPIFADGVALTGADVEVSHLENLNDGGLLVAGAFDAWKGFRRWGLFKLDADGQLNTEFVPNLALYGLQVLAATAHEDGSVGAAALDPDIDLGLVGSIHLLDPTGSEMALVESFLAEETVILDALAVPGNTTIFSVVPSAYKPYKLVPFQRDQEYPPFLLTLASNGEPNYRFIPEIDSNMVHAMDVMPDGSIVLVGDFEGFDGTGYSNIVRVTNLDTPYDPRMANISTRGFVSEGDRQLIAGFVVEGTEPQRVMIRGIGPTLADYGIENSLEYPAFKVSGGATTTVAVSDRYDWFLFPYRVDPSPKPRISDLFTRYGAFELTGSIPPNWRDTTSPIDAVMILDLEPGAYTVQLTGERSAIGLIEVYNATGVEADRRIVNLSTRGWVGLDLERLIGGFVIDRGSRRVLVRAVGPQLGEFGVSGFLEDPQMRVVRTVEFTEVAANNNWEDGGTGGDVAAAAEIVGAFPFESGSLDAALVLDLEPGEYTAIVSGVDGSTGVALVEVYELPD